MSDQELRSFEHFKRLFFRQLAVALAGLVIAIVLAITAFYYNTQSDIRNLKEKYTEIEYKQSRFDGMLNRKIEKEDYVREMDEVKLLLRDINVKIDRLYHN